MSTLPKPSAVLFDWDGTVVDSVDAIAAAINHVQDALGKPALSEEDSRAAMAIGTAKDIFAQLHPGYEQQAYDLFYSVVPAMRAANLVVMPRARAVIDALKAAGIKVGIVSNMRHQYLVDEIAGLGWKDDFDVIVGAGEAPRGKPSPDPIYLALERMGMSRAELPLVWYVGDMDTDRKASRAAGCSFLYYTGGVASEKERKAMDADLKFDDYGHMLTLLNNFSPLN